MCLVWFEPTCIVKSVLPFSEGVQLTYTSPNLVELRNMSRTLGHALPLTIGKDSADYENGT